MEPEKAALMQMQIKNNASDLQDYLKGLKSWETEVKEKDTALSSHKSILKEVGWPVSAVIIGFIVSLRNLFPQTLKPSTCDEGYVQWQLLT